MTNIKIESLIAKSGGETLVNHSVKTANICKKIAEERGLDEKYVKACYYAGLLHDVIKCISDNQRILRDNKKDKKISHAHLMGSVINTILTLDDDNEFRLRNAMAHGIGYHHESFTNKDEVLGEDDFQIVYETIVYLLNNYSYSNGDDFITIKPNAYSCYLLGYRNFNEYGYFLNTPIENNYLCLISNILKTSDIIASNGKVFSSHKSQTTINDIVPNGWDANKLDKQKLIADSIISGKNNIVTAPCGFGKSNTIFRYCLKTTKKCYWIMPMNVIVESVFNELVKLNELFSANLTIGLYTATEHINYNVITGKDECSKDTFNWDADIIVTNIDNFLSPFLNTAGNIRCLSLLERDCIFDEYQEYFNGGASMLEAFRMIVQARNYCKNDTTNIFISGTKSPYINKLLGKGNTYHNVIEENGIDVFEGNIKEYKIVSSEECQNNFDGSVLTFFNSRRNVIDYAIEYDTLTCIHSRFIEEDRTRIIHNILGKNGKEINSQISVVTTSILAQGVDVSFSNGCFTNPNYNHFFQLLGRVNRFGECKAIPTIVVNMQPLFNEKGNRDKTYASEFYSIPNSSFESKEIYNDWVETIKSLYGHIISETDLYKVREAFINRNKDRFDKVYEKMLSSSLDFIKGLTYKSSNKKLTNNENVKINSKNNFRNSSNVWGLIESDGEVALINISQFDFDKFTDDLDKSNSGKLYKYYKEIYQKEGFEGKELKNKCKYAVANVEEKCKYRSDWAFPLFLFPEKYNYTKRLGFMLIK